MDNARVLGRVPFHRHDRSPRTSVAGEDRQPFWPTGALGHGTEPVGLRGEVTQGDGQPGGRRPIEATYGDVRC